MGEKKIQNCTPKLVGGNPCVLPNNVKKNGKFSLCFF